MFRLLAIVCTLGMFLLSVEQASAQRPAVRLRSSDSENLPRGPNNQIEGAIYQYRATLPKSDVEPMQGRFRIEGAGIFNVEKEIGAPKVRESLRNLRDGADGVTVQSEAREQRIGDVVAMEEGKIKLVFMDYEALPGFAIIQRKEGQTGVWKGYFQELKDGEAGRRWQIQVRTSED
jgi:hypothetical protein